MPLLPKETSARLTLTSPDLGTYHYDLKLVGTPAAPERALHFKVGLGNSFTQTFRFFSYCKVKTDYACKLDSSDFSAEKTISVPAGKFEFFSLHNPPICLYTPSNLYPTFSIQIATNGGVEVCLDVTYEPSKLGDTRTNLVVSSPQGGDYVCPLYGHCIAPRPQGPILIKQGSPAQVPFKNVFNSDATFSFVMDNPVFVVKATEKIGSKKTITMTISYSGSEANEKPDSGGARSKTKKPEKDMVKTKSVADMISKVGKLTVTHTGTGVSWIYYLKSVA